MSQVPEELPRRPLTNKERKRRLIEQLRVREESYRMEAYAAQQRDAFGYFQNFDYAPRPTPVIPDHEPEVSWLWKRLPTWFKMNERYCGLRRWQFITMILIFFAMFIAGTCYAILWGIHQTLPMWLPLPDNNAPFAGEMTIYKPGHGSCGVDSTATDLVVSVSHYIFDRFPKFGDSALGNVICGMLIKAWKFDPLHNTTKSVQMIVVNSCNGCNPTTLDVSPAAFDAVAGNANLGRMDVTWSWVLPTPTADSSK